MNFYRFPIFFSKGDSLLFARGKACRNRQGTTAQSKGSGQTRRNILVFLSPSAVPVMSGATCKAVGTQRFRVSACAESLWQGLSHGIKASMKLYLDVGGTRMETPPYSVQIC